MSHSVLCAGFGVAVLAGSVLAFGGDPAPANDQCADATPLVVGDTAFSTLGADTDGLLHEECQYDGQTYQDIWYTFVASLDGSLTVSTCSQADYDTDLVIYLGCDAIDCPPGDLTLVGCNDDADGCDDFTSEVTVPISADQCYKIRVGGWTIGDEGTGMVTLIETPGQPACQWDLNNDGVVGPPDLAVLLAAWNAPFGPADLAALLAEWNCTNAVGACCVGGKIGCEQLTEEDCNKVEGEYFGDGSSCKDDPCGPNAACNKSAGSCFEANGSPGCDDFFCCKNICFDDPFCCDTEWDQNCADQALKVCGR
ncbi:MAG: hypothetical protein KDA25_09300 [Phycisphaerales bacterium]|nr:hypothetical protein [Phycisphaerales bacterium]